MVHLSVQDGIALLRIARPEKKNALTSEMYAALAAAVRSAQDNPAVLALVIAGVPGAFTAGNDLEDFRDRPPADLDAPVFEFMRALAAFDKPAIAAVEGIAAGIGVTLLLHCDLAYAAEDAMFALPFVKLGLVPEFASSLLLPRLAGYPAAAEKLLLGEAFGAREALAMRIVNAVLPGGQVLSHAMTIAGKFRALPPEAVRASKRLMRGALTSRVSEVIETESRIFCERLRGVEAQAALNAFLDARKRKAS